MDDLSSLLFEYNKLKGFMGEKREEILSHENIEKFLYRTIEISKLLVQGLDKNDLEYGLLRIPESIARLDSKGKDPFGVMLLEISYEIEGDYLRVKMEYLFRNEVDYFYEFCFPILDESYELYLEKLKKEAESRLQKQEERQKIKDKNIEEEEKKLLNKLKEKYEK